MRFLLVEDNERLAELLGDAFRRESFSLDHADSLDEARVALDCARYDAIILDLGLPDGDGLDLLRDIRRNGGAIPVMILSARERLDDRLAGLNAGADDYLPKPFAVAELLARIRVLLRRPPAMLPTTLRLGNLSMDDSSHDVEVNGTRLDLPRREKAVLRLLLRHPGRLIVREAMDNAVFGFDSEVGTNALEVYIHRLRKRLRSSGADVTIRTEKGTGYRLEKLPSHV